MRPAGHSMIKLWEALKACQLPGVHVIQFGQGGGVENLPLCHPELVLYLGREQNLVPSPDKLNEDKR